ncbi:MAG: hypothetical protein FJ224_12405 [Lentisphaerae bacterium]|nr:hypothetical protein [Lentisphaerota bacterium]
MRLAFIALLLAAGSAALGGDMNARRFSWEEAQARMMSARTREDFDAAFEAYSRVAADGAGNGTLFYNAGSALLKAGRAGESIECLLRSERYSGSTPELRRNLALAAQALEEDGKPGLPWYRPLLFWHYGIPTRIRISIALAAFSGVWLAAALRRAGLPAAARTVRAASAVLLVVFGSSSLGTIHAESRAAAAITSQHPAAESERSAE